MASTVHIDPSDGLPAGQCGNWASDKHDYLRRYIGITRAVRKKFSTRSEASFVDLYSGAGRGFNRDTGQFIDGSALVAWKAAIEHQAPFSRIYVNDLEAEIAQAAAQRLRALSAPVTATTLRAEAAASAFASACNAYGYHLVFLDPFDLGISLTMIQRLLRLQRVDILIHVSAMDLQRNLPLAETGTNRARFDAFAPGWVDVVDERLPPSSQREQFLRHWETLVRAHGTEVSAHWRLITGPKNIPLYWLALISRSEKAHELWEKLMIQGPGQQGFGF